MSDYIDLDALLPKPVKVKISGKLVDLYPGKLKTLVKIQGMADEMLVGGEESLSKVAEMLDALSEIIPAIKTDKEIDVSPLQVNKLIEIAYKLLTVENTPQSNTSEMGSTNDKKKEGSI